MRSGSASGSVGGRSNGEPAAVRAAASRRPRRAPPRAARSGDSIALSRAARLSIGKPNASSSDHRADGDQRPDEAAMPPERAAQHRQQPDQRIGERGQRRRQPLVPLGDPFRHVASDWADAGRAARAATPPTCRAGGRRQCAWLSARSISFWPNVSMLSRPVWWSISCRLPLTSSTRGPFGPFDQPAALGQDRGMCGLVARVVHQDAAQRAVRIARAHIDGELVRDRGEHAFLQQEGRHPVADLPLELPERREAGRHDPELSP